MIRPFPMGASLRWVLVIGVTCFLALGCSNSGSSRPPGVNLSGIVDDGGPNSPVPGASCVFINDTGPNVGPVFAGQDGRFTLRVPLNATGRIQCTPPGMTDLVLVMRVAAGATDQDIGKVDPESSLIAVLLEIEIDEGELDPAQAADRTTVLGNDEALGTVVAAINVVVDSLLGTGLDPELQKVVLDLYDNGKLDDPDFAGIADAVNAQLEAEIEIDELVVAIEEFADQFFNDLSILTDGKLLIEHNATDEDTGFQVFVDGDPWNQLDVASPGGVQIVTINALGGLLDFGLTELFFETSEPENAEVPIADVLARLDEGEYSFAGDLVDDDDRTRFTEFTHGIPAGPLLLTPADDSSGLSQTDLLVSWEPVTVDIDGNSVDIVGYQVIVEEEAPPEFPQGFAQPVFSIYLPASATQVTVPNGFLKTNGCYAYEILAIEESGNQTLSSAAFETGAGCGSAHDDDDSGLTQAKLLIEHNATDEDTGFQCFADGDPWNRLTVTGPGSVVAVVMADAKGGLLEFGLTEFFFETSEPLNAEVPIPDVLAHLTEGTYTFIGEIVGGGMDTLTAQFTHKIPAGPVLLTPLDGAEDVDPADTVVSWQPVTTDVDGDPNIVIVGYQVIVELDEAPEFPKGFFKPILSIYLPASATQIRVPAELLVAGADYEYEVLAIELSGNQTLSSGAFSTQ